MINPNDYIESKTNKVFHESLLARLHKQKSITGLITGLFSKNQGLSKVNANIGLILFDQLPELSERDHHQYHLTSYFIQQDSKRFNTLFSYGNGKPYWEDSKYKFLEFIFGKETAPLVKKAWDNFPNLMYQSGYGRRSFRATGIEEIYFERQINFLISLIGEKKYDLSLEELIIYSNHVETPSHAHIIAAAIDLGNNKIKQLCIDIVMGNHEQGRPSNMIIKGMLLSKDLTCWEAVEKLLLSAQRQEGLRQTILEALDETDFGALKHFIKVILAHNLTRFSSVVRAIDVWMGMGWDSEKESTVKRFLELADRYLNQPNLIEGAIESQDNAEVYMALWARGVVDICSTPILLEKVAKGNVEKKMLALYFVAQIKLSHISIRFAKTHLDTDHPAVICMCAHLLNDTNFISTLSKPQKLELFEVLERKIELLPKKTTYTKAMVFSWVKIPYDKEQVLAVMIALLDLSQESEMDMILGHFPYLPVAHRERVASQILPEFGAYEYKNSKSKPKTLTKKKRDFAFSILKDRSEYIRNIAIRAISASQLSSEEIVVFEGMLTRKAADFRKSTLDLIIKHGDFQVKESAQRLLQAKNIDQRLAGLDLLLWLAKNGQEFKEWAITIASEYANNPRLSSKEEMVLKGILPDSSEEKAFDASNGFGLFNPSNIEWSVIDGDVSNTYYNQAIAKNKTGFSLPISVINKELEKLGNLFEQYIDYEYSHEDYHGRKETVLLGNVFYGFKYDEKGMSKEQRFENYPLHEVWQKWYEESELQPLDLFLIAIFGNIANGDLESKVLSSLTKDIQAHVPAPIVPRYNTKYFVNPINSVLQKLSSRFDFPEKTDFLLGLNGQLMSLVKKSELQKAHHVKTHYRYEYLTWRNHAFFKVAFTQLQNHAEDLPRELFEGFWKLAWNSFVTLPKELKDETTIPYLSSFARAYQDKLISKDVLIWRMMHKEAIKTLTEPAKPEGYNILRKYPFLTPFKESCVERILEIEMVRGDSSTSVSSLASIIQRVKGVVVYVELLKALGKDNLHRGYIYHYGNYEPTKKEVLSSLLRNSFPEKNDSQEEFNAAIKEAKITDSRLCDTATYAPQWLPFVANYLGWKQMESAVWWLHAHTNGAHNVQYETEIAKYSAVNIAQFADGAVDVDWFKESYKALGLAKWKKLYASAKYISESGGHKRGLLYADVILGKTKIKEITERILDKRNQDFVRVYGVIPLSKTNPKGDILKRYNFLQQFKKESKQFGSQRQASEGLSVGISMNNLARTAGYPDPIRLQWAMETKQAQEIIEASKEVFVKDVQITLDIDENGKTTVGVIKDNKRLKSIPATLRKEAKVLKLKAYAKSLNEQYKRTRKSLEFAMIQGDSFLKEEIENLFEHPVVKPLLSKLVLESEGVLGFWENGELVCPTGKNQPGGNEFKIAHCADINRLGNWSIYQKYCFDNKLKQPFKQVFRELYIPTKDELSEQTISRRYAGHQVQPQKTVALLKGQQWTVDYDEGLQKVHHKQNVIARMFALADWFSPADVEPPTLETVEFFDRTTNLPLKFDQVDARVFSETMRDIDLVVSVAHVGAVDPEASQSTIEMRSVIVKESLVLFKLKNVKIEGSHALIEGALNRYSVHLGSGICHKIAGSSLSIIPVQSQHRGRMFLPFIDDDPKTAEIMSKVLLLAKDDKIQDPTILSQL